MKKSVLGLCLLSTLLSGCDYLASYSIRTQQGNIIEAHEVAQIKVGMSKEQVSAIMGNPILENTFDDNRWLYVYTYQKARDPLIYKKFIVIFRQNRVVAMEEQNTRDLRNPAL